MRRRTISALCLLATTAGLTACGGAQQDDIRAWMQAERNSIKPSVQPIPEPTKFNPEPYSAASGLPPAQALPLGAFLAQPAHWRVLADLFLLSACAGLYSVPMYALIQLRSQRTHRARIIAANNILNALFMIAAALIAGALLGAGLTVPQLFLAVGIANAVVAAYTLDAGRPVAAVSLYVDIDEATRAKIAEIVKETRRFAKRQETWFRKEPDVTWFSAQELTRQIPGVLEHAKHRGLGRAYG